ncbi:hypothetical protein B0T18DRAFT_404550 [Schizothecium vesticola]|uniref:Uncharacterized protein n=1 Tax=Schizothecium vesticola TaxID=314040 RepID=A0AA40KB78_9PEZI|nr:hypothetical protein B0T18DRAFT_404550 [Schizothecium vesticola]
MASWSYTNTADMGVHSPLYFTSDTATLRTSFILRSYGNGGVLLFSIGTMDQMQGIPAALS